MTWLALLLIGFGLADLAHALRPTRWLPESVAAAVTVAVGLLAGVEGARDVLALVLLAAAVVGWGLVVRIGFGSDRAWLPLAFATTLLVLALATTPWVHPHDGPLGAWLRATPIPLLHDVSTDRALLLAGGLLVQGSTGNVLVRLVLLATHTINPAQAGAREPAPRLKGGRLLGPMERLVILGLGLAGDYTAAGIVVAAKGLLRFPELQAARRELDIAAVTEYFLVGSFVSWLVALTTLVLLAR
ncbi:hypothetical protein P5P86_12020 [Nocardioides sp. BP30]|uniref:hypothetical protein n=1 Tax=Nocardioides sp. BP30 TaxID=3036374 RepID=UPI002468B56D|nr:hypothetical protein [Nocardioides sp. BP30]WGL50690.1 hypothetical protein P5P86_12020 [Nocardioides sp. BP30]